VEVIADFYPCQSHKKEQAEFITRSRIYNNRSQVLNTSLGYKPGIQVDLYE